MVHMHEACASSGCFIMHASGRVLSSPKWVFQESIYHDYIALLICPNVKDCNMLIKQIKTTIVVLSA